MNTGSNDTNTNIFGKRQMMGSALFSPQEKDVLGVVLLEDTSYTLDEAKELLERFLNKEVI
ncbi:hypothetical protein C2I18_09050 [Paenibacillus sp. PK3_47]|uniref:hypothetical protein n=1 Tax=Paenibacillus sp. PK3_47 TaxID=2072642 RepID=UPI00201DF9F1|nr:hypothetical protein [Paenibacillus sp. PK3_47]UQZ33675.1 hypothetical protein C2I18_09050 [Paenibacillus sp. PK3_47]